MPGVGELGQTPRLAEGVEQRLVALGADHHDGCTRRHHRRHGPGLGDKPGVRGGHGLVVPQVGANGGHPRRQHQRRHHGGDDERRTTSGSPDREDGVHDGGVGQVAIVGPARLVQGQGGAGLLDQEP